jgi:hypothetical protein
MQKARQKSFMKIINIFVAQLIRCFKAQVHCKKGQRFPVLAGNNLIFPGEFG